jgi:microsomal dipeptidase-like Zn-dependent dipeptidase
MKRKTIILLALCSLLLFIFFRMPWWFDRSVNNVSSQEISASTVATTLHAQLWVADLHCDALLWNRNLLAENDRGQVDIPRLIRGNVALQAFTVVSKTPLFMSYESNSDFTDTITLLALAQRWPVRTWFSLRDRALYQARKLRSFAESSNGRFRVIDSAKTLDDYVRDRARDRSITAGWLGIEGAQVLEGDITNVKVLFDAGFRMMAPSHFFDTDVGGSAHGEQKGGLTDFGREVIAEMERVGMIVDLAHASEQTIDDVLSLATRPVFVSHTGVRATCDGRRNLGDQQLRAIAAKGGLVGIGFFAGATCGYDVKAIGNAISHAVNIVGVDHVALGSDFDGAVSVPFDAAGMAILTEELMARGFSRHEISLIMGENVKRLLRTLLP